MDMKPFTNSKKRKAMPLLKRDLSNVIDDGVCECIYEPRGDGGLEGYCLKAFFPYMECKSPIGKTYFRLFPQLGVHTTEMLDQSRERAIRSVNLPLKGEYYECTGPNLFKKFFKIVKSTKEKYANKD